jgi:glutathione peroxidase
MLTCRLLLLAALGLVAVLSALEPATAAHKKVAPALNFAMNDIDGNPVQLSKYQGSVIMIVNVASLCGNTPQYAGLQKLYDQYGKKGLVILGFPSNDFHQQEPGTNAEIKSFCSLNYHVTFPLFSKIVVKGDGQAPLYQFLTSKTTNPKFGGEIEWNFAKFLLNRKGEVVARFPAKEDPLKPDVVDIIKRELSSPK